MVISKEVEFMFSGFDLANDIVIYLSKYFPHSNLISDDNFNEEVWKARIIGVFCSVGSNLGLMLEVGRKTTDLPFLKEYNVKYKKEKLGEWELKNSSFTEIDLIYIDAKREVEIGLCEFENSSGKELNRVKDNIIKFCTFSKWKNPSPILGIISFWCDTGIHEEKLAIDFIRKVSEKNKTMWWLIIPFFRRLDDIYWKYTLLTPRGNVEQTSQDCFLGPHLSLGSIVL